MVLKFSSVILIAAALFSGNANASLYCAFGQKTNSQLASEARIPEIKMTIEEPDAQNKVLIQIEQADRPNITATASLKEANTSPVKTIGQITLGSYQSDAGYTNLMIIVEEGQVRVTYFSSKNAEPDFYACEVPGHEGEDPATLVQIK